MFCAIIKLYHQYWDLASKRGQDNMGQTGIKSHMCVSHVRVAYAAINLAPNDERRATSRRTTWEFCIRTKKVQKSETLIGHRSSLIARSISRPFASWRHCCVFRRRNCSVWEIHCIEKKWEGNYVKWKCPFTMLEYYPTVLENEIHYIVAGIGTPPTEMLMPMAKPQSICHDTCLQPSEHCRCQSTRWPVVEIKNICYTRNYTMLLFA